MRGARDRGILAFEWDDSRLARTLARSTKVAGQQVLIVDDSPEVRQELRTLLPIAGEIEVVGEAANGGEAISLARSLHPQVVLLDLHMPIMDGYEAARAIRLTCPSCRIVALTVHDDASTRQKAADAGVDVFLVKGAPLKALVDAIAEGSTERAPSKSSE
jgi:DNA-binding NarL/FixJ family response regulator